MSGTSPTIFPSCRIISAGGLRIPFALHVETNRYVDASMVDSGEACGCKCPGCGEWVVAKHRRKRNIPHFSHHENSTCPGAFETSLHKAAKQAISELFRIALPPSDRGPMPVFRLYATHVEYDMKEFIPDVFATDEGGNRLAIEIRVTHEVDHVKRPKIQAARLDCIEYDLSRMPRELTYDILVLAFTQNALKCCWVHNEDVRLWREENARVIEQRKQEQIEKILADREIRERREREQKKHAIEQAEQARRDKWRNKMGWAMD